MNQRVFSYAKFDLDSLLSLAQSLRGRPCTCDVSQCPKAGSLSWVIFLSFDDGVEWVFRSPRTAHQTRPAIVSDDSASKMLASEVSTLKYLKTYTTLPVPSVYSFSASSDNETGVPYILMSKADGRALSGYDWTDAMHKIPGYTPYLPLLPVTESQRIKVMKQLGAMMGTLSTLHFDKIGSLFEDKNGHVSVGECLLPSLVWDDRDSLEGIDRGPFSNETQYFGSLASVFISHAKELAMTTHAFFAPIPEHFEYSNWQNCRAATDRWNDFVSVGVKIEGSKNRFHFCLAGQLLQDIIPQLCTHTDTFTLSHPDLHLGNIFVDDDFNVTCIIDWGSASTGPLTDLLATPGMGASTLLPSQSLTEAFRSSFGQIAQVEPDLWTKADMMWYYHRLVYMISKQDYTLFKSLYSLAKGESYEDSDVTSLFLKISQRQDNKQLLAGLQKDDFSDEEIKEQEAAAFGNSTKKQKDLSIARKLTVMSEINPEFIADHRLWKWIELVLDEMDGNVHTLT